MYTGDFMISKSNQNAREDWYSQNIPNLTMLSEDNNETKRIILLGAVILF